MQISYCIGIALCVGSCRFEYQMELSGLSDDAVLHRGGPEGDGWPQTIHDVISTQRVSTVDQVLTNQILLQCHVSEQNTIRWYRHFGITANHSMILLPV